MLRARSASAPPTSLCFVSADVSSRNRSRETNVMYERNVDQLVCRLSTWTNAEVSNFQDELLIMRAASEPANVTNVII